MDIICDSNPGDYCFQRIYYKPIEAAIRWANISYEEEKILKCIGTSIRPTMGELEQWPLVYLFSERIFDAIIHDELPVAKNGIRCKVEVDNPDLTVRHIDLRRWMAEYYPFENPCFLFTDAKKFVSNGNDPHDRLYYKVNQHSDCSDDFFVSNLPQESGEDSSFINGHQPDLKQRAENTYLSIIGAMLSIILNESSFETSQKRFKNQEALIYEMLERYPGYTGLSERTLRTKFAMAKRKIISQ